MNTYEISMTALEHNIRTIIRQSPVPVWGVLKYDGYGVGLSAMAKALQSCGIDRFAVCTVGEAATLRRDGFVGEDILLVSPQVTEESRLGGLEAGVIFSVGSRNEAESLHRLACERGVDARIHIAVDTGLGRFGFLPEDEGIEAVYRLTHLRAEGIYSHFSSACTDLRRTQKELNRFQGVLRRLEAQGIPFGMAHIASSAAFYRCQESRLDAVRLGSALVGRVGGTSSEETGLQNVVTLVCSVLSVKTLPAGSCVGYCGECRLFRRRTVAVLSAGAREGLPALSLRQRLLRRYPTVEVAGHPAPIIATSSAGHAIVDVTGLSVSPGDTVRAQINPLHLHASVEKIFA